MNKATLADKIVNLIWDDMGDTGLLMRQLNPTTPGTPKPKPKPTPKPKPAGHIRTRCPSNVVQCVFGCLGSLTAREVVNLVHQKFGYTISSATVYRIWCQIPDRWKAVGDV